MIVAIFILISASLAVFIFIGRQRETVWLAGIYTGFILINIGLMLYYAKMGGVSSNEQFLFFIFPQFQRFLQDLPIPLNIIAAITTVGQSLFIYFTLIFSLEISGLLNRKWLFAPAAVLPALNLIICNADFLLTLNEQTRDTMLYVSYTGMFGYFTLSLAFMLREYFGHTIAWVKKQLRWIILSIINLIAYYLIYCQLNPLYIVSQNVYTEMIFGFPLQYRLRLSFDMWIVSIVILLAIYILGVISLYKYTKITIDMKKENLSLERQIDTASMGVRVFIHGIKNRLLSEKIILERLKRSRGAPGEDEEHYIGELEKINVQMTAHIDALYNSFKLKAISMVPHRVSRFARPILDKYRNRYPEIRFELVIEKDSAFMADMKYLGEAVENIMKNAVEAIQARWNGPGGAITVTLKANSRWSAIRVDDNGAGMSRDKLAKIFKPFFTDKKTGSNWGIGLSSAQQIVKHHFGRIYAESRPGQGTFFVAAFPRLHQDIEDATDEANSLSMEKPSGD